MHLILTGATGLVGSGILNQMLPLIPEQISKLTILSRGPVPMADGKPEITIIKHKNFNEYPASILKSLEGAEGCIWAQGVSQSQVCKEEYITITKDYPLAAAKAFSNLADTFKFVYISGEGATTKPGIFTQLFATVKGECEQALLDMSKANASFKPYSLRPAFVDPHSDAAVREATANRSLPLAYRVLSPLGPLFRTFAPGIMSPTQEIGMAATALAMGDGKGLEGSGVSEGGRILSNEAIRRIAKRRFAAN
ncbi:hypothetical protein AJ78_05800 [Emergomyces pasteurianus Ep9510]|uniref:NAD(P)-binding domain-containing protein n=1 Tax=Emergomyces pasteurianus Ep9510 TaxID=1447872 RepID=A0A1J9QCV9_9EURO|nr:hypothetical protein AJ78_05800 [Emergomyces pasteurianus Ep9510]